MASETLVMIQIGRPEKGKRFGQKDHYLSARELLFLAFLEVPGKTSSKTQWPALSPVAILSC